MADPRLLLVFVAARAVLWAGAAITMVALPILMFQRTGSAALSGALAALEAAPYLVLGAFAGALADRWDHRRTLAATTAASSVVMASIPAAQVAGLLSTAQLLLCAVLNSALFVFFDGAGFGVLPRIVGSAGIASATGRMMTIGTVIGIAGPAVGGGLAAAAGPATAIAVEAVCCAMAALLFARMSIPAAEPGVRTPASLRAEIAEGWQFILQHPLVRSLTLLGIGNSVTGGAVGALIVVIGVQQLRLPPSDARIGLMFAAASVGSLAAGLAIAGLQRRARVGVISLVGFGASAALAVLLAQASTILLALPVLCLWQAANSIVSLNGIIVRQVITPARLQGRVNTTARMVAWGGAPAGAAIAGILAEHLGTRVALCAAASGVLLSMLLGLRGGLARHGRLTGLADQGGRAA